MVNASTFQGYDIAALQYLYGSSTTVQAQTFQWDADAAFSQSYYELGMIYVRSGKTAEAKANLEKYLELDPSGRDAATAKEMMNYLK